MAAITIYSDFGAPQKIKSVTVSTVSPAISHELMGPDAMILVTFKEYFENLHLQIWKQMAVSLCQHGHLFHSTARKTILYLYSYFYDYLIH